MAERIGLGERVSRSNGITGLVTSLLGVHPFIAAGLKYAAVIGLVVWGVKAWEARVAENALKDQTIETQSGVIEAQKQAGKDRAEDEKSKETHTDAATDRETDRQEQIIRDQNRRIQGLESENEALRNYADSRPCLREPWPDRLQRRGGYDLNRGREDAPDQTGQNRGSNAD